MTEEIIEIVDVVAASKEKIKLAIFTHYASGSYVIDGTHNLTMTRAMAEDLAKRLYHSLYGSEINIQIWAHEWKPDTGKPLFPGKRGK